MPPVSRTSVTPLAMKSLPQRVLRAVLVLARRAHVRHRVEQHIGVQLARVRHRAVLGELHGLAHLLLDLGLHLHERCSVSTGLPSLPLRSRHQPVREAIDRVLGFELLDFFLGAILLRVGHRVPEVAVGLEVDERGLLVLAAPVDQRLEVVVQSRRRSRR
jgi:hypothetical protein